MCLVFLGKSFVCVCFLLLYSFFFPDIPSNKYILVIFFWAGEFWYCWMNVDFSRLTVLSFYGELEEVQSVTPCIHLSSHNKPFSKRASVTVEN